MNNITKKNLSIINFRRSYILLPILFNLVACSGHMTSDTKPKQIDSLTYGGFFHENLDRLETGWNEPRKFGHLTTRALVTKVDYFRPTYFIQEPFYLNGHLLAYWDIEFIEPNASKVIDAQPERTLYLRFYPQGTQSQKSTILLKDLIALAEDSREAARFFIYHDLQIEEYYNPWFISGTDEQDEASIHSRLIPFGTAIDTFIQEREGIVAIPVYAKLSGVATFHDSASTFLYAQIDDLKPWPEGAEFYSDIYDFAEDVYLGRPWMQTFALDDGASIYAHPDEESKITEDSPRSGLIDVYGNSMGKVIEKISSYNSEWYLVNFYGEPDTQFYVRVKDLWVVN